MRPATAIESNGKNYPFSFGMAALARFCESEGLTLGGLNQLGENMSPMRALALVHAGLVDGARREGKTYNGTLEDVGDILDDDPDFLEKCMEVVNNSMPQAKAGNGKAANRKASR